MCSTRKAPLRRRTATSSSPVVAVAAVVAVAVVAAVVVVVGAADAAAAVAAAAVGVSPGAVAGPGVNRGHLPRVIDANNHGRARQRRPGLFMCTSGAARTALLSRGIMIAPNSLLTKDIRAPIGLRDIPDPGTTP